MKEEKISKDIENKEFDKKTEKVWKEDEILGGQLALAYFESVLDEYGDQIKKSSKEEVGFNAFADGIRLGLDIIMPLLLENSRLAVRERIKDMVEMRFRKDGKEDFYAKNEKKSEKNIEEIKNAEQKIEGFMKEVGEKLEDMDENNKIAEEIAKKITLQNVESLKQELMQKKDVSKEESIRESFFRGVWMVYFLLGNHHGKAFLKDEKKIVENSMNLS